MDDVLTVLAYAAVAVAALVVGMATDTVARSKIRTMLRRHEEHRETSITELIGGLSAACSSRSAWLAR